MPKDSAILAVNSSATVPSLNDESSETQMWLGGILGSRKIANGLSERFNAHPPAFRAARQGS
jgi:hypothetical protein